MKEEMTLEDFLAFFKKTIADRLNEFADFKYEAPGRLATKGKEEWTDELFDFGAKRGWQ
jgi:hypothetical protein